MPVMAHDAGYALASCGHALVGVWAQPSTLESMQAVQRCEDALAGQSPEGIVILTVIKGSAFAIGARERAEAQRLARRFDKTTVAEAYVIEGDGFRTAAMRAMLAGLQLLARASHPVRVFADVPSAVEWLGARARPPISPGELVEAVRLARAAVGNGAARLS